MKIEAYIPPVATAEVEADAKLSKNLSYMLEVHRAIRFHRAELHTAMGYRHGDEWADLQLFRLAKHYLEPMFREALGIPRSLKFKGRVLHPELLALASDRSPTMSWELSPLGSSESPFRWTLSEGVVKIQHRDWGSLSIQESSIIELARQRDMPGVLILNFDDPSSLVADFHKLDKDSQDEPKTSRRENPVEVVVEELDDSKAFKLRQVCEFLVESVEPATCSELEPDFL